MTSEAEPPRAAYKLCPRCRQIYPAGTNFCVRDRSKLTPDEHIIAGRYILLEQIGAGTMSEVYLAEQPQLGRKVAVKILHRDLAVQRRFDIEVQAVGRIRHDHVVIIHDSGRTEDGRAYLAMEYLEGLNLANHIRQDGPLASERAMLLWKQAVSAIAAAHRLHIVHRDIKPANLILTHKEGDDGPEEILKVIDFSIAKLEDGSSPVEHSVTDPGSVVGTMLYMAPEQLGRGQASPASDVYSLGLVLIEMLTGRLPWSAATAGDKVNVEAALRRLIVPSRIEHESQALKEPSEELLHLAGSVLNPDPQQRPADAGELLRRIKRLPEMAVWQNLPRRLAPNKASYSDLSHLKYSPDSAISRSNTEEPSWPSEGKAWLDPRDEVSDPTMPAEARSTGEKKLHDLVASLAAESIATPAAQSAEDLPTMKDDVAPAHLSAPTPAIASPPEAAAPQEVILPVRSGPTAITMPKARQRRRSPAPIIAVGAGVALLILLLQLKKTDVRLREPEAPRQPPMTKLVGPDLTAFVTGPAAVVADLSAPNDLASPPDLGAANDLLSPPDLTAPPTLAQTSIKVQFYFGDLDNVAQIRCGDRPIDEKKSPHRVTIDVALQPSDVCQATSEIGDYTKSFRYDKLVEKREDRAHLRRVHVRFRGSKTEDPSDAVDIK